MTTLKLDPFRRVLQSAIMSLSLTPSLSDSQITVTTPGLGFPTGSGESYQVAWSPDGSHIAWGHDCNYVSPTNFGTTVVVASVSGTTATPVAKFGLGYDCRGLCWIDNSTLATGISGNTNPSYPSDHGLSIWDISGTKLVSSTVSNLTDQLFYENNVIFDRLNGNMFSSSNLVQNGKITDSSNSKGDFSNQQIVAVIDSSNTIWFDSYQGNMYNSYIKSYQTEGNISLPETTKYTNINELKWSPSGVYLLVAGQLVGSTSPNVIGGVSIYQRTSAGQYSELTTIKTDPTGGKIGSEACDWIDDSTFVFAPSENTNVIYKYNINGTYISSTSITTPGVTNSIAVKPGGGYIGWAGNHAPYFRIYSI